MDVVKAILIQKGMSIKEFADKAGVSRRTIDPYISGTAQWSNARAAILLKVADALDVDPHLLVNGKAEIKITSGGGSNFIDEFNQAHTQEEKDRVEAATKLFGFGE